MNRIQENTFAAACYNQNSINELQAALAETADKTDMRTWDLTEEQYKLQIKLALDAKLAELIEE